MLITDCNIVPLDEEVSRRSLGFYTETETQRLYYYFSVGAYEEKWKIYRFAVDKEPLEWEFVGDLDIKIKNVCVSPCGRYFWSIQITRDNYARFPKSLFFRQVDIRTLDYIEFETPALTYEDGSPVGIRSLRFQHTTHNTFLFFHVCYSKDRISKFIDEVYLLDVDPVKRQVHFKHIDLPNLLTGDLFPVSWFTHPDHHSAKWCVGLVEHQHSVYFYRIDYFGDLYVLNYQSTGPLNWTKFSITGNYRPAAWITYSIRDIDAAAEAANEYWVLSTNRLDNSKRFFLEDGIVFEYTYDDGPIVFYQLEFQFESLSCECSKIFRTKRVFWNHQQLSTQLNKHDGSRAFVLHNFYDRRRVEPLEWELISVGSVPNLKHLAYWAVRNHLRPKTENRCTSFLNTIINRLVKLVGVKRQNETPKEDPNWPEKRSRFLTDCNNIVFSVNRAQRIYLLKMLAKKK